MSALQRPAYLANRGPSQLAGVLAGGIGTAQPPRISLKDDRFTLLMPNGDRHPAVQPSLTVDVIVVGGNPHASRIFYDGDYDSTASAAPACWSDNGVAPSANAGSPQSETCAMCPQAVWGSKISANGSKIPACSTVKKVAVLVGGAGDVVFLLQIPPASLKPWRGFLAHIDTLGASVDEIIVRVKMEDKALAFEAVDFLPQNVYDFAQKIMASPEPDVVCGVKDKPHAPALAAPAPVANGFLAQPAPAPVAPTPPAAPVETDEQREAREFAEFKASKAKPAAEPPAPAASFGAPVHHGEVEPPAPRQRAPRGSKKETVVGPGPIAVGTFQAPQETAKPASFIGGGAPATPAGFGMAPPTAPGADVQNALAKAFNMPLAG